MFPTDEVTRIEVHSFGFVLLFQFGYGSETVSKERDKVPTLPQYSSVIPARQVHRISSS